MSKIGEDNRSGSIFDRVMDTLQEAEEISGPEGEEYIALMERIAKECLKRVETYRDYHTNTEPHSDLVPPLPHERPSRSPKYENFPGFVRPSPRAKKDS